MKVKPETRDALIESLEEILFEVQYAQLGHRTATRKLIATQLVDMIISAVKISKEKKI